MRLHRKFTLLLVIAGVALAYFLSAKFAFNLVRLDSQARASVLFPAIGISLSGLLLGGRQAWIGVMIGAIWFGRSLDNVTWTTAIGAAIGSVLEVVVAYELLNRVGFDRSLRSIRDVLAFVGIAAVFAPMINATISTINGSIAGLVPSSEILSHWLVVWFGDGVSILVFTPAIVTVCSVENANWKTPQIWMARWRKFRKTVGFRRRMIEVLVWLGSVLVCSAIVVSPTFNQTQSELCTLLRSLLQYVPFLFAVWAALRLGVQGTVLSALIVSFVSIWAVAHDHHYFVGVQNGDLQQALFRLQAFIGVMTTTALVLAAAIAERKQVEIMLRKRIDRDELLAESTLSIRRSLDVIEVLNATVAEVRQFLNADRVYVGVFDSTGYAEIQAESVGSEWRSMLGTRSPRPIFDDVEALLGVPKIHVNPDSNLIQKNSFLSEYYEQYQIKASIGIALEQDGRLFGVLNVNQCDAPRQWEPFEVELLDRFATQVELALQQGRLYQQVQSSASNLEQQVFDRTELLQLNMQQLQATNEVKDRLLHAVAHDLRTPIVGMLMFLKRLQTKSQDDVTIPRAVLDRIVESGDRQLSLIRSLLEDYSSESQELVLNCQLVSLTTLIQETLEDLEPLLSQNHVLLNPIMNDLPLINADLIHLRRVIENLITNALKHNPPDITITVETMNLGSSVKCTIADNGVGMTQAQCEQLFKKPYLRVGQNTHRTGLGLGLFLCNQIIVAHGGQIGVNSRPNAGAEFWFTIPLA